ncbi:MAG: SPASM domain-containing protein [Acidobacteriota bacterium]
MEREHFIVQKNEAVCKSVEDNILSAVEVINILKNCEIEKLLKPPKEIERLVPNLLGCVATTKLSLIVGPRGEIYKCTKTIGDEKEICGTIFNINYDRSKFKKWVDADRLNIEQCRKCSMVPICSGNSCPYDFLINNKKNKCSQKERYEHYLEMLRILYQQKRFDIKGHDSKKNKEKGGE